MLLFSLFLRMKEIWCMIEISQALLMFLWRCRHSFIINFLHKKKSFSVNWFFSHSTSSTNMMIRCDGFGSTKWGFSLFNKNWWTEKGSAATTSTCHHHHRYEMVLTHSFHCILTRRGSYIVCASMFLPLILFYKKFLMQRFTKNPVWTSLLKIIKFQKNEEIHLAMI